MGAPDGAAALESARKIRPSAILSDVMMPVLDGFALCQAVRNDPELCSTPLVLTTNTYVEVDDRELAKRVGADDLVIRTPELREAIDALVASLEADTGERSSRPVMTPAIERERTQRVFRQLEKQVALNSALMQRCAALSAELSVLSGISGALTEGDDVSKALDAALAACLDAGGVSSCAARSTCSTASRRTCARSEKAAARRSNHFSATSMRFAISSRLRARAFSRTKMDPARCSSRSRTRKKFWVLSFS